MRTRSTETLEQLSELPKVTKRRSPAQTRARVLTMTGTQYSTQKAFDNDERNFFFFLNLEHVKILKTYENVSGIMEGVPAQLPSNLEG